jgi:hypothetical protein
MFQKRAIETVKIINISILVILIYVWYTSHALREQITTEQQQQQQFVHKENRALILLTRFNIFSLFSLYYWSLSSEKIAPTVPYSYSNNNNNNNHASTGRSSTSLANNKIKQNFPCNVFE